MKNIKIKYMRVALVAAVACFMLSGCDAEEPAFEELSQEQKVLESDSQDDTEKDLPPEVMPALSPTDIINDEFDPLFVQSLRQGLDGKIFKVETWSSFYREPDSDNPEWTELLGDLAIRWFAVNDGYAYRSYAEKAGYHPRYNVAQPWGAYEKVTGDYREFLLRGEFNVTEDERAITIDDLDLRVEGLTPNGLTLSYVVPTYGGYYPGESMYVAFYTMSDVDRNFNKRFISFETEKELLRYVIDKLRETFGDVINLNEVYAPYAYYDNPILKIDDLERQYGLK